VQPAQCSTHPFGCLEILFHFFEITFGYYDAKQIYDYSQYFVFHCKIKDCGGGGEVGEVGRDPAAMDSDGEGRDNKFYLVII
jgi:hypothetical protein